MNAKRFSMVSAGLLLCTSLCTAEVLDLAGAWKIALDPGLAGRQEAWYRKPLAGQTDIQLPGSLPERGYGNPAGPWTAWTGGIQQSEWDQPRYAPYRTADNFKMPFWLQADRYYMGPAWYQRSVTIPSSWAGKHITLILERPHWETTVWVGDHCAGTCNSLSTAHTYDLSDILTPGTHTLTVCVDNRMVVDVGPNSHSVSDHTQSNWNGIVGTIELRADSPVWIDDLQVYPDIENSAANLHIRLGNHTGKTLSGELKTAISLNGRSVGTSALSITAGPAGTEADLRVPIQGPVQTWDEFNPVLYTLDAALTTAAGEDQRRDAFGMRKIDTQGNQMVLNGRPIFLRGTLECCIFPLTGYPPTDVDAWKRIITVCKAHGLNHIRFHSWCPPEAAFIAADQLGFYFQVECSSWCNYGGSQGIGNGKPVDRWLYDEADAILKAYGNHPSFLLLAYGNEPGGPERGAVYLRKWVPHYQQKDPRRLVTSGSGWPLIDESDYHVTHAGMRIQGWGEELNSRINSRDPETVTDYRNTISRYPNQPMVAHEIGQWCVYPNFDEMKKYTGVLKPKNFEIFHDFLEQKHMLDQAQDFLMASGKLQVLCYKEDIESALRTPHFGGFQLLDLHDFPGQGTALVGVLDPFWDSKPYVTPAEYKRFCDAVVPLVRLEKRIFTASETLSAGVEISQFGPNDLTDAAIHWTLQDADGNSLRQGILKQDRLTVGALHPVGRIDQPLSGLPVPAKYVLSVEIKGTAAANDWDIWVYPDRVNTREPDDVLITQTFDRTALDRLSAGGKVLLTAAPGHVKTDVKVGFSSIFWNTAWTRGQAPHTLGILCDPDHPALAAFPTEYHSNWQWSDPIRHSAVMEMDHLPVSLRPIVQVVPDWFNPKRLGLVFEVRIGRGRLLLCSVDIDDTLDKRPVTRQLRHSLLRYMASPAFNPDVEVDAAAIEAIFRKPSQIEQLGAEVIGVDSFEPGYEGQRAIDGDPSTLWHTSWSEGKPAHPHRIQIKFGTPVSLAGITCLPRQDGNPNGWIKDYAVYVSDSPDQWGRPAARGTFSKDAAVKTIRFEQPVKGQYLCLTAESDFGGDPFTSLAELDVIAAP